MMERGGEGRVRTDDIASGGGGEEAGTAHPPPREGEAQGGVPAQGAQEAPQQGGGWQPQSPRESGTAPNQGQAGRAAGGASDAGGGARVVEGPSGGGGAVPAEHGTQPDGGQGAGGAAGARAGETEGSAPLLPDEEASDFERRWQDVQVGFVDEPQRCVQDADALVAEVMQRLADGFARERKNLEAQWAGGGEASTEDLRVALQRYRSFFNRLLRTT
jgi:hypothetical protein